MVDTQFYEYVSKLLYESGHMITSDPVYFNHSASEALYIDSSKDVAVSRFDRMLLMQISNVSRLLEIKWPGEVDDLTENVQIYSITIDAPDRNRSQIVADTHRLLHQYWDCHHSVVFFKNRDQYLISFANKDQSHILSDWFDINIDYDEIVEKIDTANLSLESSIDYFSDFIYAVARDYYIHPISVEEATYGMIPLTFVASAFGVTNEVSKEDIKAIARANMSAFESQYGDDYVAPVYIGFDEQAQFRRMATELDKISFELELAAEMDDDEIETFDDAADDDFDEFDDFTEDWEDDVDAEIFDDPVLMVKWLEQRQRQLDSKGTERQANQSKQKRRNQDPLEAEISGIAHIEAEYHESEHMEADLRACEQQQKHAVCKRKEADEKRSTLARKRAEAERKRIDAEHKRSEAARLVREQIAAECKVREMYLELERREQEYLEAERRERVRLEAERRERERLEAELREQERLEAERREQERLEAEKRKRARYESATVFLEINEDDPYAKWLIGKVSDEFAVEIYLAYEMIQQYAYDHNLLKSPLLKTVDLIVIHEIHNAVKIKREFQRLDANTRYFCGLAMRHYLQYATELEAEREECERLQAERLEQERLEAIRIKMDELEKKHGLALTQIEERYSTELAGVDSELLSVEGRLSEIESRLSVLGILQFIEKKGLKTEQATLLAKKVQLINRSKEIRVRLETEIAEEKQHFQTSRAKLVSE